MEGQALIRNRESQAWDLDGLRISRLVLEFHRSGCLRTRTDGEAVRLHFGLRGTYSFACPQLDASFELSGHHHNMMYTDGLDLEIHHDSPLIETFGIDFEPSHFLRLAAAGGPLLQAFAEQVRQRKAALLSPHWQHNHVRIRRVIQDILHHPYTGGLEQMYLHAKSSELLVLVAEQHAAATGPALASQDQKKLAQARDLLDRHLQDPPALPELARRVGLNEYKLKKGFREEFGTTVFGYVLACRMERALQLLLDEDRQVQEAAFELGYSSPQHFSRAFRKYFGISPNDARNYPDRARSFRIG